MKTKIPSLKFYTSRDIKHFYNNVLREPIVQYVSKMLVNVQCTIKIVAMIAITEMFASRMVQNCHPSKSGPKQRLGVNALGRYTSA